MEFKYAISLLFSNMGYVLRIFAWVLISMVVTVCVGAAIMVPVFDALGGTAAVSSAYGAFTSEISAFLDDGISIRAFVDSVPAAVGDLLTAVASEGGLLAALIIELIFLYALYSFLLSFSYYPTAYSVKQLMSSNMRFSPRWECSLSRYSSLRGSQSFLSGALSLPVGCQDCFSCRGRACTLPSGAACARSNSISKD